MTDSNFERLQEFADSILPIMHSVGVEMLSLRERGLNPKRKPDNSFVTEADLYADRYLAEHIGKVIPNVPIVSEESFIPSAIREQQDIYWCIDPLDSTKNYIDGGKNFSINIALIQNTVPILGLMTFPAMGVSYIGIPGQTANKVTNNGQIEQISAGIFEPAQVRVVVSSLGHSRKDRLEQIIPGIKISDAQRIDGAIKFAHIAEGRADLYPRFTNLSEWDLAAGDAIIHAAGGSVTDIYGQKISYGKNADFSCPHFIAFGKK